MKRRLVLGGCVASAILLIVAFTAEGEWYSGFGARYGFFQVSPGELALRYYLLTLVLPASALLAAAGAIVAGQRALERFDALGTRGALVPAVAAAACVLLMVTAVRVFLLRETALTDDENVYTFQAQLLASGRMWVPSAPPAVRAFFDNQFIVNDGRRYGLYFIGHAAVLAAAALLGVERWLGGIEAALLLLVSVDVARRLYGSRAAVITAALLAVSPFFLALFASRLSEPTSALFLVIATWAATRVEEQPRRARWWMLMSGALSAGMLTRPQGTLCFGAALVAPPLWSAMTRRSRPGSRSLFGFAAVAVVGAVAFGWSNAARTGSAWRTGYAAYLAQGIPWLSPIGLGPSLRQISEGLGHLNVWWMGWPISLVFVPFFGRHPMGWRLAAGSLLLLVGYGVAAVPTVAPVGPVYYGEIISPLAVLSASGIEQIVAWSRARHDLPRWTAGSLVLWPPVATTLAFLTFVPTQAISLARMGAINAAPYDLVSKAGLRDAVVFVKQMPGRAIIPGTWAYYHRNSDPDLAGPVLFVRDLGTDRNKDLLAYLRGRRGYRFASTNGTLKLEPIE